MRQSPEPNLNADNHHAAEKIASSQMYALYLAWLISIIAMLTSLYFSEIKHYPVCHLCWYQRVCLYPLTVILGMAAFREDFQAAIYGMALSFIGLTFAIYQYLEQMIPGFSPVNLCGPQIDCARIHFKLLGFITFPFLSIITCLLIFCLCLISLRKF